MTIRPLLIVLLLSFGGAAAAAEEKGEFDSFKIGDAQQLIRAAAATAQSSKETDALEPAAAKPLSKMDAWLNSCQTNPIYVGNGESRCSDLYYSFDPRWQPCVQAFARSMCAMDYWRLEKKTKG